MEVSQVYGDQIDWNQIDEDLQNPNLSNGYEVIVIQQCENQTGPGGGIWIGSFCRSRRRSQFAECIDTYGRFIICRLSTQNRQEGFAHKRDFIPG